MEKEIKTLYRKLGITYDELMSKSKLHAITDKRHVIWFILMKSYKDEQIAEYFSCNKSAIGKGAKKVSDMIEVNDKIIIELVKKVS